MNITIIGAGNVGTTLGKQFARVGHSVIYGVRNPQEPKYQELNVDTIEKAIAEAEIVCLTTPWSAALETIRQLDLKDKLLVDCTNPIKPMLAGLEYGTDTSGAEQIAQLTAAKVVKAFNTTGVENMQNPHYGDHCVFLPVCSDDRQAGQTIAELATAIGFDGRYIGPLQCARYLEPYAMVWIHMAIKGGFGRQFALVLQER